MIAELLRADAARHVAHRRQRIHLAVEAAALDQTPAVSIGGAGHHLAGDTLVGSLLLAFRERRSRSEGNGERRNRGGDEDFFNHDANSR